MTIVLTALATLLVTIIGGIILDYFRNARPRVAFGVKDAVPIDMGDNRVGAYLVSLANASRRVVKDVTCHIKAPPAKLRNGGVSASQGLQYSVTDAESGLQITIPYLKANDEMQVTVIAEAPIYVPTSPDVAIRSPHELNVVAAGHSGRLKGLRLGFLTASVMAAVVSGLAVAVVQVVPFTTQRDILTFAASLAQLPRLAEMYATTSEHTDYYNQGDLAYALASASSDRVEIMKYRKLLVVLLDSDVWMLNESRANLYYSLGKIDILLGDKNTAIKDFQEALSHKKSTVEMKAKLDSAVHQFMEANAIR